MKLYSRKLKSSNEIFNEAANICMQLKIDIYTANLSHFGISNLKKNEWTVFENHRHFVKNWAIIATIVCAYLKIVWFTAVQFLPNLKIGSHLRTQFFAVRFSLRNMGKIVPQLKKNSFFKMHKSKFYRVKRLTLSRK